MKNSDHFTESFEYFRFLNFRLPLTGNSNRKYVTNPKTESSIARGPIIHDLNLRKINDGLPGGQFTYPKIYCPKTVERTATKKHSKSEIP